MAVTSALVSNLNVVLRLIFALHKVWLVARGSSHGHLLKLLKLVLRNTENCSGPSFHVSGRLLLLQDTFSRMLTLSTVFGSAFPPDFLNFLSYLNHISSRLFPSPLSSCCCSVIASFEQIFFSLVGSSQITMVAVLS